MTRIICGVDIASSSLAARIGQDGAAATFANTPEGIRELAACQTHQVALVAMEATGGYETAGLCAAVRTRPAGGGGQPACRAPVRANMGWLEKTDAIDAGMIAWYAQTKKSQPLCLAPQTQLQLRARVTRLRQLTEVRTAQLNQQRLVTNDAVQNSFRQMLTFLAAQIEELQQAIAALIDADPLWRELNQAFRTIKGVADRTVARIMAEMPEIGTLSNKTISKLAGLAPLANDSGKHQGKRAVRGGHAAIRDILFIVGSVVAVMNRISSPSSSACAPPANRPKSFASPWHISCSSASTPKPARFARKTCTRNPAGQLLS